MERARVLWRQGGGPLLGGQCAGTTASPIPVGLHSNVTLGIGGGIHKSQSWALSASLSTWQATPAPGKGVRIIPGRVSGDEYQS